MKLLIATPLYPPEPGGPATYSKLLEDGLPPLGIEVTLVKFSDVRHLPKLLRHAAYFFRVLRAARNTDIVYALDAVSVGYPAMLAAKFARKPFIVKIVGDYAWEQGRQRFGITQTLDEFVKDKKPSPQLGKFRRIQTRVANSARRIIVPSKYLKGIVAAWGVEEKSIEVIHNAIRAEATGEIPKAVADLPRPLVVSVGRLVPWKGFSELIQALSIIRQKSVLASLVIVGDGQEKEALQEQATEQLRDGYVFTGQLSHAQTYNVMLSADVFVLDSLYEGLSHSLLEAFVAGVPVIVSDVGGNTEIVENEENGLVVAPEDPKALAEALERVLSDKELYERLKTASKSCGVDFSVEMMLQKTHAFLESISSR